MKNNDEAEKLSNEEKPLSQNNNSAQNVSNNTNTNQNNKIESSNNSHSEQQQQHHYHINMNNNNNAMNNYFRQQYGYYQDISKMKYFYYYIMRHLSFYNNLIQFYFSSLTESLDMSLYSSNLNSSIKGYIHTKQIFLIIYIFNIQYLLSIVEKITFFDFLNTCSKNFMVLSVILLYIHYNFFKSKLFVEKDEELEKFVLKRNPQLKKGKCEKCDVLKLMRSNHCLYCNKCVKKYQFHSNWFNICIGANNELIYAISTFFICLYFFISNLILWYYIIIRNDLLTYLTFIYTIFALVGLYINFLSGKFLYKFIFECLFTNLTWYEKGDLRRFIYLQGNYYGIFNPFDKGIQRNLEEMLVNMFDINIYSEYKNYNCQDLSEIIEEDDKNNEENHRHDIFNDIASFKLMIKSVEHFDPLITSKGNIYKFVDGKEIINWNRCFLFTVFDLINSPVKDSMVKQAKYYLEQNEAQNKKIKEEENKNEKMDEKENSEDNKDDKENEQKNLINTNSEDNNN